MMHGQRNIKLNMTNFFEMLEKGRFLDFSASALMHLRQSF